MNKLSTDKQAQLANTHTQTHMHPHHKNMLQKFALTPAKWLQ